MSDEMACCILGICCPSASEAQREGLAKELVKGTGCAKHEARELGDWILEHFDLAPKGTLQPFKDAISAMAKHAK